MHSQILGGAGLVALALTLTAPAAAQVQPIPDRGPGQVGPRLPTPAPPSVIPGQVQPRQLPDGPLRLAVRPSIVITPGELADGRAASITVRVTGLGDARAVHLYMFDPGCDFAQSPGLSPVAVRQQRGILGQNGVSYTTDNANARDNAPEQPGLAVAAGVASFTMSGRVGGARFFTPDEERTGRPDLASAQAIDGVARYESGDGLGAEECTPRAKIRVQDAAGTWRAMRADGTVDSDPELLISRIQGRAWRTIAGRRIVYNRSADLRDLLSPRLNEGQFGSVCSGTSSAIGGADHPVGVREVDGDIVFRARSGPGGTRCYAVLGPAALPAGATARATFSVTRTGTRCRVIGMPFQYRYGGFNSSGQLALNRTSQMAPTAISIEGAGTVKASWSGWLDPYVFPETGRNDRFQFHSAIRTMAGQLLCDATAVNDHGVELRLDSIEVTVPNGVAFP